jgi:hypothetical protein
VRCNASTTCHGLKSVLSSNAASVPGRGHRNMSTVIRHCFMLRGALCFDVPPQVDRCPHSFPVRSHGFGIMFLHEERELFGAAQCAARASP